MLSDDSLQPEDKNVADWIRNQWDIYFIAGFPVFAILDDGRIVSFCSVTPSNEVGYIYTIKTHRRQGLAKLVLAAATQHATNQGALAHYCVEDQNEASMHTALAVGYRPYSGL